MKRMTKKDLEAIRQAYHMGNTHYSRNLNVENLVNEVEACWRERKKFRGELKACQETMLSLSGKLTVLRNKAEKGCNV